MSSNLSAVLYSIRDVEGVYGSFVVSSQGTLIERDMPAVFDGTVLEQAGVRVASIYETFDSVGNDIKTCMLRFKEHKLYTRRLEKGYLCVLSPLSINMPTLRMAVNLVARRINPSIARFVEPSPKKPGSSLPRSAILRFSVGSDVSFRIASSSGMTFSSRTYLPRRRAKFP